MALPSQAMESFMFSVTLIFYPVQRLAQLVKTLERGLRLFRLIKSALQDLMLRLPLILRAYRILHHQ